MEFHFFSTALFPISSSFSLCYLIFSIVLLLGKPSMPEKPLVAKDIQKTELTLTWKPSKSDGGSPIKGYAVEKRESWKSSWVEVDRTRAEICELKVKRLKEGQEYFFRVCAENKIGQSDFLEMDASVTPKSPFCKYSLTVKLLTLAVGLLLCTKCFQLFVATYFLSFLMLLYHD